MPKPIASLSLDVDNLWSYLKVHGDPEWQKYPSFLDTFTPIVLNFLEAHDQTITFFIVGRDAEQEANTPALRRIAEAGHEIGNHSLNHEPWMQNYEEARVLDDIRTAHLAIEAATGQSPIGFRGPGYSQSDTILIVLDQLDYVYDASIFPSIIGPLARFYYFWNVKFSKEERETRGDLFGHVSDGFKPIKPFAWQTAGSSLYEIPVSTIPVFRVPFHLSYILWLSRISKLLAMSYLNFAFKMCRLCGVEPSFLLHPLDFLGKEDVPELKFFPGMDLPREHKLDMATRFINCYKRHYAVGPIAQYANGALAERKLKTITVPVGSAVA